MGQDNQNSAVAAKNSQNEKENKERSASAIVSGAVLVTFFNAYIYFFGYTYFKAKMSSLGFDSASIEDDIGAVYYNAFECFGYLLQYGLLPLIKSIDYTLLFKFYDTPIILTVIFFLFIYFIGEGIGFLVRR